MKHGNLRHFLTLALALVLLGSLIPAAASAYTIDMVKDRYDRLDPNIVNFPTITEKLDPLTVPNKNLTIYATDYGKQYEIIDGKYYEFVGMNAWPEGGPSQVVNNGKNHITLPGFTGTTQADFDLWKQNNAAWISLNYTLHEHTIPANAPWIKDHNHHWKVCPECKGIAYINWHHDVDNNGICDQCGDPIFYRYVSVKDAPGGKVEISKEKCMLGNRIAVNVTPKPGYKLADIRGISADGKGSIRPCYQDVKGSKYHMIVDVYDVEIRPTFVKE